MKRNFLLGAALALACGPLAAQSFTDQVIDTLAAQGYQTTEVKVGPTQTKVEAVKGTTKVEVVYDRATGKIVKQETEYFGGAAPNGGVEIKDEDRDFTKSARVDDDDDGDDSGKGRGRGRGRSGSDDSSDDDSGDDRDDDHDDDRDDDHDDDRDDDSDDDSDDD